MVAWESSCGCLARCPGWPSWGALPATGRRRERLLGRGRGLSGEERGGRAAASVPWGRPAEGLLEAGCGWGEAADFTPLEPGLGLVSGGTGQEGVLGDAG